MGPFCFCWLVVPGGPRNFLWEFPRPKEGPPFGIVFYFETVAHPIFAREGAYRLERDRITGLALGSNST